MRVRTSLLLLTLPSAALSLGLYACDQTGDVVGGGDAGADGKASVGQDAALDSTTPSDAGPQNDTGVPPSDGGPGFDGGPQQLVTSLGPDAGPAMAVINQGIAIGGGAGTGGTPSTLTDLHADPKNTDQLTSSTNPFLSKGTVPDRAAGFCVYPEGGAPYRITHVDADAGPDLVPVAPFYFPLVYNTPVTGLDAGSGNAVGGQGPMIGLFDYRPKDIDEAVVAAESDDNGQSWYFMQTVLELNPDYTNPISGGYDSASTSTGCPSSVTATNSNTTSASGSQADDGWGHAAIIQLPGSGNSQNGGQFLYLLDRNTNNLPGDAGSIVDNAPLHAIQLTHVTTKFPIWNTNKTNNDIKSITSALASAPDSGAQVVVQDTVGLLNPDGIMAVFPTAPSAASGSPVKVLYVQKILNGDTSFSSDKQCNAAPVSGKTNHDISNVRLAETTDGIHFDENGGGIVQGLNDPTTVDYNETRWISPRGTLIDINGDGSRWGLYFSGGNCLDGDSDAFHYIGYAESSDMLHWTVYNGINNPIASINVIKDVANQNGGAKVTIPANAPVFPTQPWFAERLYAPTATQIDPTHISMTFAGYAVQTPSDDLLNYRTIGNVVLTVSKPLPPGTPNNINAHK